MNNEVIKNISFLVEISFVTKIKAVHIVLYICMNVACHALRSSKESTLLGFTIAI